MPTEVDQAAKQAERAAAKGAAQARKARFDAEPEAVSGS